MGINIYHTYHMILHIGRIYMYTTLYMCMYLCTLFTYIYV